MNDERAARRGPGEGVILLVEDNPDEQVLTERAFRKNGISNQIVVARDGVEAVAYLFGTAGSVVRPLPVVVLLDLKLPKMGGLQVLERLRADERTRRIPVVVLTSSDEDRDYAESRRLGADSYVRKPVDFNEFTETVRQMWPLWLRGLGIEGDT
ncbi:MAG: response regulator [Verrucomicrobiota bacterium]